MQIYRRRQEMGAGLSKAVREWLVILALCLTVWGVLSPLFYEEFYSTAKQIGDFTGWMLYLACFLIPLLLFIVSATRNVVVETRNQYFPSTNTNNADLPVRQTLVRASSEPPQTQQTVLLRAAGEGQATPPEELVRPAGKLE